MSRSTNAIVLLCLVQLVTVLAPPPTKLAGNFNFEQLAEDNEEIKPIFNDEPIDTRTEADHLVEKIQGADHAQLKDIVGGQTHQIYHQGVELKKLGDRHDQTDKKVHHLKTDLKAFKAVQDAQWHNQEENNKITDKGIKNNAANVKQNRQNIMALHGVAQDHQEKIETQRDDHEKFVAQTNDTLGKHKAHMDVQDGRLDGHDQTLADHTAHLGKHGKQIGALETGLAETNAQVEQHGDKLKTHDILIKTNINDISDLNQKTAKKFDETDAELGKVNTELGVQNGRLNAHDAHLGQHDAQITGLQGDLQTEKTQREEADAGLAGQLDVHAGRLDANEQRLGEHSAEHGRLHQGIKNVEGDVSKVKQQHAAYQDKTDAHLAEHDVNIAGVQAHANKLEGQLNVQNDSLQQAHGRLDVQGESLNAAHTQLGQHQEVLDEHGKKLTKHFEQIVGMNKWVNDHQMNLDKLNHENLTRQNEIVNLQDDVDAKDSAQKAALGQTNVNVGVNTANIAQNTKEIGEHQVKLGEHDVVLDKYGNIIVIHDNTFVKHGSRIDHIEERFNEQDQNVEDLVKKQTLVDDEILNAQKEVNQLVLKSEQSVLEATKKAVENMKEAATLLEQKMDAIKKIHEDQQQLIANHIAKEKARYAAMNAAVAA